MKNTMNISKQTYIAALPEEMQNIIASSIQKSFIEQGITDNQELSEAMENALSSRLSDIEEVFDISMILNIGL